MNNDQIALTRLAISFGILWCVGSVLGTIVFFILKACGI